MNAFRAIDLKTRFTWQNLSIVGACLLVYVLVFVGLFPHIQGAAATVALFPAILAGWRLGKGGGLLVGVLVQLINIFLFPVCMSLFPSGMNSDPVQGIPLALLVFFTGWLTGWLVELLEQVRSQAAELTRKNHLLETEIVERARAEEALQLLNEQLDAHVQTRTAQLLAMNDDLQKEVASRKVAEEKAKISAGEKEILLKEVHHRVKNNLQIISSLLNLQVGLIEDQTAVGVIQDSQHRIRAMAMIHEKLYQSHDLANIEFADYINSLAVNLFYSYGVDRERVQLTVTADEISMVIDAAVPCGLIMNELISNALKHAFPHNRSGNVNIDLRKGPQSGLFVFTVVDDGVGIPDEVNFAQPASLGLQLVHLLVNQQKGCIELDRSHGTRYIMTIIETREAREPED